MLGWLSISADHAYTSASRYSETLGVLLYFFSFVYPIFILALYCIKLTTEDFNDKFGSLLVD
jgi:hypothetical protein